MPITNSVIHRKIYKGILMAAGVRHPMRHGFVPPRRRGMWDGIVTW